MNQMKAMKKYILIGIIVSSVLFVKSVNSQFTAYNIGTTAQLNSIFFINPGTGFCAGNNSGIYKSTNGGVNWITNTVGSSVNWQSIFFTNENSGIAVGNNQIALYSGITWTVYNQSAIYDLLKVQMVNTTTGYILGKNISTSYMFCLKTTNSGVNWTSTAIPGFSECFDMFFLNASTGFVCGQNADIMMTTNGGVNWAGLTYSNSSFGDNSLKGIRISPVTGIGFAAGVDPNYAYKTTNSGANWSIMPFAFAQINGLTIFGTKTFACGDQNVILKSSNAGSTWTRHTLPQAESIKSIFAADTSNIFACGTNGTVYKTTNGGGNPVGITSISSIAESFELHQNYPNPFNPSTKIRFSLPKSGEVKLRVFSAEGRVVSVLINDHLNAGEYQATFESAGLASGVYFYQLESGNSLKTQKMILFK